MVDDDSEAPLQGNLFGPPEPIRPRPKHPPGVEAFLPEPIKEELRAHCIRMQEPMSKIVRALVGHFNAAENRDFRRRILLRARDDKRKPRGNPKKGGQTASRSQKKDDNPTPNPSPE